MDKQVVCEHPRIIINPKLPSLLAQHGVYVFRGVTHNLGIKAQFNRMVDFNYTPFSVKKNKITRDDLEKCYVVSTEDGQTFPIYLEVPCGKCDVCRSKRVQEFVYRCRLETEMHDYKPWFVTLTYDENNLPTDRCVHVRHVQLFMKRFRVNLERSGYNFKIRYAAVGELGSKSHRPHYHMLLWGIDCSSHLDYMAISLILKHSWKVGFVMHRLVDPSNDKSFYYTGKYLQKGSCTTVFVEKRRLLDPFTGEWLASEIEPQKSFFFLPPVVREVSEPDLSAEYLQTLGEGDELIMNSSQNSDLLPNRFGFHDI